MGGKRSRDRRLSQKPGSTDRRGQQERRNADRRADVRVPIDLWMEEVRGDEVYFRRSCNLSEGGVFFDQSIPHPVGTEVTLRFTLPGTTTGVQLKGEVVSAARADDGLGMGVKFLSLSADDRKALKDYVTSLAQKRGTV